MKYELLFQYPISVQKSMTGRHIKQPNEISKIKRFIKKTTSRKGIDILYPIRKYILKKDAIKQL